MSRLVIQLFNGNTAHRRRWINRPDPPIDGLSQAGLVIKTIPPNGLPWNPFTKMHNAFRGLDPLRALRVLLRERDAALVCAHMESAVLILLARKLCAFHAPVIIWEVPWSNGWRFRDKISRLAIPRADCCVVFGTNQIDIIHDRYGYNVPVLFVPFCIDTEFYCPTDSNPAVVPYIWSCGMDEGRDFETLLLASESIDVEFRVRTGLALEISSESHPNVIQEKDFLQPEAFRERYANASVVVVSTQRTINASGVTSLMEALSMGRPTIVTDNPGIEDYLPPSDAAIIIPVGDVDALRRSISYLLDNPETARAMGLRAREFAQKRYGRKAHYNAMGQVFLKVINGRTGRRT